VSSRPHGLELLQVVLDEEVASETLHGVVRHEGVMAAHWAGYEVLLVFSQTGDRDEKLGALQAHVVRAGEDHGVCQHLHADRTRKRLFQLLHYGKEFYSLINPCVRQETVL
jgi:hypothetical protein